MDEFVTGVKAVESDWLAVLGTTLTLVFYRKMPLRLAKRLSAGFQDKESKPQAKKVIHFYEVFVLWQSTTCNTWYWYCRMKYGVRLC